VVKRDVRNEWLIYYHSSVFVAISGSGLLVNIGLWRRLAMSRDDGLQEALIRNAQRQRDLASDLTAHLDVLYQEIHDLQRENHEAVAQLTAMSTCSVPIKEAIARIEFLIRMRDEYHDRLGDEYSRKAANAYDEELNSLRAELPMLIQRRDTEFANNSKVQQLHCVFLQSKTGIAQRIDTAKDLVTK